MIVRKAFTKNVKFKIEDEDGKRNSAVIDIEYGVNEDGKLILSFTGHINNGGSGQICSIVDEALQNNHIYLNYNELSQEKLARIIDIWKCYHLNDMHAECEHQRLMMPQIIAERGKEFFFASNLDNIWTIPELKKCPKCGYKYGTTWNYMPIPEDIVKFLWTL